MQELWIGGTVSVPDHRVDDVLAAYYQGHAYIWGRQDAGDRRCVGSKGAVEFSAAWARLVLAGGNRPQIGAFYDKWIGE